MREKIKILYFVDRMRHGGIQTLLLDWSLRLNKEKFNIEFLLLDDGNKYDLEDKLIEMNIKYHKLDGIWVKTPFDYLKYTKKIEEFFKNNSYDVVHLNSSSKNYIVLKYAKKYNIPIRIAHSHNTDFQTKSKFKKIVGNVLKWRLNYYTTHYLACSKIAGEWLFGKKIIYSQNFKVIHNSIDYKKYEYDSNVRNKIRKQLNIDENTVLLGNVGRFEKQKNHCYLIDIFYEYNKLNSNSKLLLIGNGSLEEKIKEKVQNLDLNDKVIFAGYKSNVNEFMQGMDIFLMPSLYEGLGIVLIEAQASGIPCFASNKVIPIESKINDNFEFVSLKEKPIYWAQKIFSYNLERVNPSRNFKRCNYFIEDTIIELEKLYSKGEF